MLIASMPSILLPSMIGEGEEILATGNALFDVASICSLVEWGLCSQLVTQPLVVRMEAENVQPFLCSPVNVAAILVDAIKLIYKSIPKMIDIDCARIADQAVLSIRPTNYNIDDVFFHAEGRLATLTRRASSVGIKIELLKSGVSLMIPWERTNETYPRCQYSIYQETKSERESLQPMLTE